MGLLILVELHYIVTTWLQCDVVHIKINSILLQMWMNVPLIMVAALRSAATPLAPTNALVRMGLPYRLMATHVKVCTSKQHWCCMAHLTNGWY